MKTILIRMKSRANGEAAPERRARRRETLLGALILAAALALFVLLTAALCRPLAGLLSDPARLRAVVRRRGAFGVLSFFGLEVAQGFLPLPLEVTTVAAGYLFGPFGGFLLTSASVLTSTTLLFTLAKLFGERFFLLLFPHGESPWILRDEKARRLATWTVFLVPGLPKRLFILSAALVPQRFSRFLAVSTLARVPALIFCSFGGHALGSGNYARAVLLLCVVAIPALAAFFIYRSATARKK
ncbi:TVP38/TMEM64 family protein [Caproicibacter sp.]|uniref:TVP38/TMEM64 family protein n=1 Tax=Caproicibacter sp. TaxID=2814884 RepID=UPI003989D634